MAATDATGHDAKALPGLHTRLKRRGLAARRTSGRRRLHLPDPSGTGGPRAPGHGHRATAGQLHPHRKNDGSGRDDFHIDFDRRQASCSQGETEGCAHSRGRHGPYPTSSPTAAPLVVARFTKSQCRPCPVRTRCTITADSARTVGFPPRELRDLQLRVRAEQKTPEWQARYAVRSGVEGTINEFAHGHGMRRCRYRGQQ
ncbi:transposase [Streptomyces sp. NK08204]|uniref:transposase n=1 Tax=Streptomyces sp. NK08204 TaxID=2873260 RepID=UPI001CECF448|nr:transposase [Streptomyces sp. NK08204]